MNIQKLQKLIQQGESHRNQKEFWIIKKRHVLLWGFLLSNKFQRITADSKQIEKLKMGK